MEGSVWDIFCWRALGRFVHWKEGTALLVVDGGDTVWPTCSQSTEGLLLLAC